MKIHVHAAIGLALCALVCGSAALAGPAGYWINHDYFTCKATGYEYGDAYVGSVNDPQPFDIWELGARVQNPAPGQYRLEFTVLQDIPKTGAQILDSYSRDLDGDGDPDEKFNMTPGDLWITLGSENPFSKQPGLVRHAVAMTTRTFDPDYQVASGGNVVRQKYPGEVWPLVTEGNLYLNAVPATGTFEAYQQYMLTQPNPPCGLPHWWYAPDDQDGDHTRNSYLTLIKDYGQELIGHSAVQWDDGTSEGYWYWDPTADGGNGDWVWQNSYRIMGHVDLDQLPGYTPGMPFSLFLSMECGNDGAEWPPVAEPGALALFAGALPFLRRKRRR
jgi:hypothetical protein